MVCLHWQSQYSKTSMISWCDIAFLTCLGQMTEVKIILSVSCRPKWSKQVRKAILFHNIADIAQVHPSCSKVKLVFSIT
jgi:hypothetical protein